MRATVLAAALLAAGCGNGAAPAASNEHAGHGSAVAGTGESRAADADNTAATARSPVVLDAAREQALGVRTAKVTRGSFTRDVRTTGILRVDERRQSEVHVKFEGFVERVFVNFVGRSVRSGERLLSVYSPELFAAEAELAQSLADLDRPRAGPFAASDRAQAEALASAARQRLRLLDVPSTELARLERTRTPSRTVVITSPMSGTVLERNVVDGMRIMPEMPLLVIADLTRVWVIASVFEADLGSIRVGDHGVIRFRGGAAAERDGLITFISPTLDETTRTAQLRIELDNADGSLRPGLFAEVTIHVIVGDRLAVPETAVIATGLREIVFVQTAPGHYDPRVVRTGVRAGGLAEVIEGLTEGQTVATSAQFLLDSESQMRTGPAGGAHGGH